MMEFPPENYHVLSYPRMTVLVTVKDRSGRVNAITIAWHSPVSMNPPLYGISLAFGRASHPMIEESGEWVVNFLPISQASKVHFCGRSSGRDVDKLERTGLSPVPSTIVAPPRLGEAFAALECRTTDAVKLGDHTWFTGEVLAAHGREGSFTGENPGPPEDPLLYLGFNSYTTWGPQREKYDRTGKRV